MLKIFFPRQMADYMPYLLPEAEKDLVMVAEEEGILKGLCGFYYQGETAVIHQLSSLTDPMEPMVMDGLFRTVMFHLMEMDCQSVSIVHCPPKMNGYFEGIGFKKMTGGWYSDRFPALLFSGCPSCQGVNDRHLEMKSEAK